MTDASIPVTATQPPESHRAGRNGAGGGSGQAEGQGGAQRSASECFDCTGFGCSPWCHFAPRDVAEVVPVTAAGFDGQQEREQMSALMSSDGVYRYQLHRSWGHTSRPLVWIMLNPSTADHATDDPTIRRVRAFTKRDGFCAFTVVNLFALRSTDPRVLTTASDPVGDRNDSYISEALQTAGGIVCAWGGSYPKALAWRVAQVADLLDAQPVRPVALGFTAAGDPRHPLYVRGDASLLPWPLMRAS